MLVKNRIRNAIFHWYSGPINVIEKIVEYGYFFSINSAMFSSENGRRIISKIPKELILTETDFPYIAKGSLIDTYSYLSDIWGDSKDSVKNIIRQNFSRIIRNIE